MLRPGKGAGRVRGGRINEGQQDEGEEGGKRRESRRQVTLHASCLRKRDVVVGLGNSSGGDGPQWPEAVLGGVGEVNVRASRKLMSGRGEAVPAAHCLCGLSRQTGGAAKGQASQRSGWQWMANRPRGGEAMRS